MTLRSLTALFLSFAAMPAFTQAAPFQPTRFTVVDQGTPGKPDVLLIPGLTSGRQVWAAEAAKLAPSYRLHLVQIDGFAGQPAGPNATGDALLQALVDQLHGYIAAAHMHPAVVGHSLGGLLTLLLAQKYPADVSKIVIVDTLPFYGMIFGPQLTVDAIRPTAIRMRDGVEAAQTPEQRAEGAKSTAEMLVLDPEGRKIVQQNSVDSDPRVFGEAMFEDLQTDLRPQLASIKTPALVLYPYDPTLTYPGGIKPSQQGIDALYHDAYQSLPNVRIVRVDNSRHFILFDQPAKLDELLQAFLKS